jgi:hypothetical protein
MMNFNEDFLLLANPRKILKAGGVVNSGSIDTSPLKEALQILEAKAMENPYSRENLKTFSAFLCRNVPEILACFERTRTSDVPSHPTA